MPVRCSLKQTSVKQITILFHEMVKTLSKNMSRIPKRPQLTTNKTAVFENFFFLCFLAPQISKCVDDNTKYQVQNNNYNNEEE